jgi:hypothetical protein
MINSYLESYKSIVKHNGYILENIRYIQQPTKDIAFQETFCVFFWDRKLEEREPSAMHHQRRRGHR